MESDLEIVIKSILKEAIEFSKSAINRASAKQTEISLPTFGAS